MDKRKINAKSAGQRTLKAIGKHLCPKCLRVLALFRGQTIYVPMRCQIDVPKLIRLHKKGVSANDLAGIFNLSSRHIYRLLDKYEGVR